MWRDDHDKWQLIQPSGTFKQGGTLSSPLIRVHHICGTSLSTTTAPILASYQYSKWRVSIIFVGDPSPHCTEAPTLTSIPPCLRVSIPKLHPYWQHINIQDASIWQHINIQNVSILATHQYLNCIHIGINTQTALILATHQYPKFIHAGSTSIPKIHPYRYNINTQDASISASHQYPKEGQPWPQLVHHRWPQRYLLHFLQPNPSLLQSCCQRRKRLILCVCIWKKAVSIENHKPNKSITLECNSEKSDP